MTSFLQLHAALAVAASPPAAAVPPQPTTSHAVVADAAAMPQVPGYMLAGMGIAGLAIVAASARRRQSGRSVSS